MKPGYYFYSGANSLRLVYTNGTYDFFVEDEWFNLPVDESVCWEVFKYLGPL